MILHVGLQCSCCCNKIKKILCKFPQIRDQVYDKKQNTVTITVICCSPEKIRDKLCCKGGKSIKSIEIKEPEKKKDNDKDNKPKTNGKLADDGPPKQDSKQPPPPLPPPPPPDPVNINILTQVCCGPCSEGIPGGPCYHGFGRTPPSLPPPPSPPPDPVNTYIPIQVCCGPCSEGIPGGPCYHGFGRTPPPPPPDPVNTYIPTQECCGPCSEGIPGGPCYHGFGRTPPPPPCYYPPRKPCSCYGRPCYMTDCDCYTVGNPAECTIM
ncbi:protein PYRICULARIA ORYZAE RESISTANCE 21-like isoform X2 [Cornus florida]|nr:protein PYRICULARIA ORYZAE RESISTANCE 21-like isoform X2 [Cornus florida]